MTLSHYSNEVVYAVYSVPQDIKAHGKPRGFWVSVDGEDDWKQWCNREDFRDCTKQKRHIVTLNVDANILVLPDPQSIDAFTNKYRYRIGEDDYSYTQIDWSRVANSYKGIIIAPYIWERRLTIHTSWYYTWDCASGCIWDASAIQTIACDVCLEEVLKQ
jgi:hypothetical protein